MVDRFLNFAAVETTTVHRLYNTDTTTHLYTTDVNEAGVLRNTGAWQYEEPKFMTVTGDTEVHRFFHTEKGHHILTADANEFAYINNQLPHYRYEGVAFTTSDDHGLPDVHRFRHDTEGSYFYTNDVDEFAFINNNLPHLIYEGIAFKAAAPHENFQGDKANDIVTINSQDIFTWEGNDTINVTTDHIEVYAGDGNDIINTTKTNSESGETLLSGGNGKDIFNFYANGSSSFAMDFRPHYGNSTIIDFDPENDLLNVRIPNHDVTLDLESSFVSITSEGEDTRIVIDYDNVHGEITLLGVDANVFSSSIDKPSEFDLFPI
ncbi:MAG: hypothetical protein CMG35_11340 [Candidatus Marinimicrobia bacterium]|nr:hypothetical protein [Candidatus Neomarinimicrobiota bacterium]|tara:strand:+ start:1925 stop:2884 length:960 start_codon:yes stop_codon:yes gene_type:complete